MKIAEKIADQFRSGSFADPATALGALVYAVVFALAAWLVGRALNLAVRRVLARDTRAYVDRTTINFLAQLARLGAYLFAFISYAHLVPALAGLGTAWLASAGVAAVVLGMAAQNTLGNLISGISLLLYRPFKVGDRLQVMGPTGLETGTVDSLNLGYTLLKTDDNRLVVVPNSAMAKDTVINLTGEDPRVICSVPVTIGSGADIDKARAILLELARKHPKAKQVLGCPVTQVGASGVVLTIAAWCPDAVAAGELKCFLLEESLKGFAASGIAGPLPPVTVVLKP